jgi:phosphoribosylglycinamide formyltransferase-1
MNIAVLASTNGTDLQAIIDEIKKGNLPLVELKAVISNKKDCFAIKRSADQGFVTFFIDPDGKSREEFDREVLEILQKENVELIVLVGFMRILSAEFVIAYENKIINIHPALIPKFSGKGFFGANVHQAVIDAKETESGCTIHFVDEGCDTGRIILQKSVAISANETPDSLKEKVQNLEKKYYPWVIKKFSENKVKIVKDKVIIED